MQNTTILNVEPRYFNGLLHYLKIIPVYLASLYLDHTLLSSKPSNLYKYIAYICILIELNDSLYRLLITHGKMPKWTAAKDLLPPFCLCVFTQTISNFRAKHKEVASRVAWSELSCCLHWYRHHLISCRSDKLSAAQTSTSFSMLF